MLKMSRLPVLIMAVSVLLSPVAGWAASGVESADPSALLAQAEAEQDPAMARGLYCQAAQAGSGPAQLYMGLALIDELAEGRNMAAGMLWLDAAIRSGVAEAKEARRAAGRLATPKDFERYRIYNNSQRPIPCGAPDKQD